VVWELFFAEDAAKLSAEYDRENSDAESSLIEGYEFARSRQPVSSAMAGSVEKCRGGGQLRRVWVSTAEAIAVEQFRLEFRSGSHDQKFSFIANFVYVDGPYRLWAGVEDARSGRSRG